MEYLFVLGRQPLLSLAEIISFFRREKINTEIILLSNEILLIKTSTPLRADHCLWQLGGTVKIAASRGLTEEKQLPETIVALLKSKHSQKIIFGLSGYGVFSPKEILEIGLEIKKRFQKEGWKSRFVSSRQTALSSVIVKTNKLLTDRGAEIILIPEQNKLRLGQTLAVQPFAELSERDYGRPGRDAVSGMLPPKLAKIMINLAEINTNCALLDPFCGSGTILTEAAMMGYLNLFGSDINLRAAADAQKNLEWLKEKNKNLAFRFQILKSDARHLSSRLPGRSIDAIVTEPWLGPPLRGRETEKQIRGLMKELGRLYLESFREFKKILKAGGKIIMVWPVFQENKFLPLLEETAKIGFKIKPLLPSKFSQFLNARQTLVYARPNQKIKREVLKFVKT